MDLKKALKQIDALAELEFDESIAESLRSIIRDVELVAVKNGQPDIVKACQVKSNLLSVKSARLIISKCLALLDDDRAFLTPSEAAHQLRVSENKILTWIRGGRLQALNVNDSGRPSYRISPDDLKNINEQVPSTPARKRKRKVSDDIDYFPNAD